MLELSLYLERKMTYIERIYDANSAEVIEREYTKGEIDEILAEREKAQKIDDDLATKAAEKSALLAKLGITEDEAKLLLS
jgi:hypothetical protein